MLDFTRYPDLASRSLAGSVIGANDELFAPRQNLIMPGKAVHAADAFGHTGRSTTVGRPGAAVSLGTTGRSCGSGWRESCTGS